LTPIVPSRSWCKLIKCCGLALTAVRGFEPIGASKLPCPCTNFAMPAYQLPCPCINCHARVTIALIKSFISHSSQLLTTTFLFSFHRPSDWDPGKGRKQCYFSLHVVHTFKSQTVFMLDQTMVQACGDLRKIRQDAASHLNIEQTLA